MFLVGLSSGSFMTLNGTVLLRYTDPRYMGRVMSLAMLAFGGFGLLGLPFGMLADAAGEGPALGGDGRGRRAVGVVAIGRARASRAHAARGDWVARRGYRFADINALQPMSLQMPQPSGVPPSNILHATVSSARKQRNHAAYKRCICMVPAPPPSRPR